MTPEPVKASQPAEEQHQQNLLLKLQNSILEHLVRDHLPYVQVLEEICHCAEQLVPDALASVMMVSTAESTLSIIAAPSAPDSVLEDLKNIIPSPNNGSCANAVYSGKPTFVRDTLNNHHWGGIRHVAKKYQIQSCWSFPIFVDQAQAKGSFALSSFEQRDPNEFQINLLSVCASLVALVWQRQQQREALWQAAHHDTLTGLPNRKYFSQQLEHALNTAERTQRSLALMFIDLDNFKDINDSFGHEFGDRVIVTAMKKIQSQLRRGDCLSRHGGDEFLLLLENFTDQYEVRKIAKKLLSVFQSPLLIDEHKIMVQFSIGISLFPGDGNDVSTLIKHADIAMYQAKSGGKNNIEYFKPEMADKIYRKVSIEQQMREAIAHEEFELYYQPQFDLNNGSLKSLEALIRWNHPQRGLLLPCDFLPIAEQSNLISELSRFVVTSACGQCADWVSRGLNIPKLAINFSTSQLTDKCAAHMSALLELSSMDARHLEIEVTETLVMNRGKSGIDELNRMKAMGITLALDDFGTGYSSLSQLRQLPIHKVKIDRSFVHNMLQNEKDASVILAIIAMSHSLGLEVVAEGVETVQQRQMLEKLGCDLIQGFYLGKPVPVREIERLL